ncbi:MAG: SDR family NAD(P)-dependent oxidoreductase [Acidimicrobiales bacterium]
MADDALSYNVEGKKVLVTGASVGIGAGIAEAFAAAGATVGICARREARLATVLERCQTHAPDSRMWVVDLADLDRVQAFAAQTDDQLGGIDILVNNAGIPKRRAVLDLRLDEVDDVMALNYLSPVRLTLALLPRMVARGGGRVVTISSVAARLGPPHEASYAASKAAIAAFMECAAVDLDGTGVLFHLVNPGIIDTDLFTLPDNEPSLSQGIDALPVEQLAAAVLAQLRNGTFEIYVPDWFAELASARYADLGAFVEGSQSYVRSLRSTP